MNNPAGSVFESLPRAPWVGPDQERYREQRAHFTPAVVRSGA